MNKEKIKRIIIKACELNKRPIIIMGTPGPTGKTTLCKSLNNLGYNAIEISEEICNAVTYDRDNHLVIEYDKIVVILNEMEWKEND